MPWLVSAVLAFYGVQRLQRECLTEVKRTILLSMLMYGANVQHAHKDNTGVVFSMKAYQDKSSQTLHQKAEIWRDAGFRFGLAGAQQAEEERRSKAMMALLD